MALGFSVFVILFLLFFLFCSLFGVLFCISKIIFMPRLTAAFTKILPDSQKGLKFIVLATLVTLCVLFLFKKKIKMKP